MSEHEEQQTGGAGAIAVRPKGEGRLEAGVADGNKVLAPADWQMLSAIAETVCNTEFVPAGLRGNSPKVLACMLYGHALGISPMIALKEIAVIDGTPSMSSALMVAKVIDAGHSIERIEIRDTETGEMTGTTAQGTRGDNGKTDSFTFTINMARRAGLMGKKNWSSYPEAMLWWRASSQLCSFLFPDVFMGSPYMPEELGADTPVDAALELVHGAEDELRRGGAVSPAAASEDPATPSTEEALAAPEAPAAAAAATESAQEVAARLAAKLEGVAVGTAGLSLAQAGEHSSVRAEDFWTPLDDRDPTEEEYAFARHVIGDPESSEEDMAAAQVLVEAYEEANPTEQAGELSPTGVVVKGTAVEIMLQVVEATERGDREWLEALLEQEKTSSRPRIRVVRGVEEAIAKVKGEPPAEEEEPEPETEAPFAPTAETEQPELGDPDTAAAQLESNPTGHRFDPTIPIDELDHAQAVVRVRAVAAYMEDQRPEEKSWKYEALVAAASNQWKLPVTSLEDLELYQLQKILNVAPEDAVRVLEVLTGEQVEKLAATAPGSNPS